MRMLRGYCYGIAVRMLGGSWNDAAMRMLGGSCNQDAVKTKLPRGCWEDTAVTMPSITGQANSRCRLLMISRSITTYTLNLTLNTVFCSVDSAMAKSLLAERKKRTQNCSKDHFGGLLTFSLKTQARNWNSLLESSTTRSISPRSYC